MNKALEAVARLREFNKWRRGKGKKYQQPGIPFDVEQIGKDIDFACSYIRKMEKSFSKLHEAEEPNA